MTRVLITGGLGFLGSALVNEFASSGFEVRIFNRQGRRPAGFVHPDGHPVVWGDIRDASVVDDAVRGMNVVVHTVSNFREARTDDPNIIAIGVDTTRAQKIFANDESLKRFITNEFRPLKGRSIHALMRAVG